MKQKIALLALCLPACGVPTDGPLFRDVVREPPLVKPSTAELLATEERALAEWIYVIQWQCNEYGCVNGQDGQNMED